MSKAFVPLLIFVLMVTVLMLASEAFSSQTAVTPTAWQRVIPSTSTPVPQVERTQWWTEIQTPTPKPTSTPTITPTEKAK